MPSPFILTHKLQLVKKMRAEIENYQTRIQNSLDLLARSL